MLRKFIMVLGATTALFGIIGGASASPLPRHASTQHDTNIAEVGQALLSGYEQEGLTLREDPERQLLLIGTDPAALHAHDQTDSSMNQYHLAVRDVLSAAASYAYLYFGLHPDASSLSVQADIEQDGAIPASNAADEQTQQPALSFTIPRPSFPISSDRKPDAYSAQTISAILGEIDPSKTAIAPWLKARLQPQASANQPNTH
ncbi:hypothetical protein [Acetobacter orientalis]|uniref:hypothetical protein n=1 Tax=Acetobacter orientalis TaxID=146474 RepID=UPI0039EAE3D5